MGQRFDNRLQETSQPTNQERTAVTFTKTLAIPKLASYKIVDGYKVFDMNIQELTTMKMME